MSEFEYDYKIVNKKVPKNIIDGEEYIWVDKTELLQDTNDFGTDIKVIAVRRALCSRCGTPVKKELELELALEYPYYCPVCDENMFSFEVKYV